MPRDDLVEVHAGENEPTGIRLTIEYEPDPTDGTPTRLRGNLVQTTGPDPGIKITVGTQPADVSVQEQLQSTFSVTATGTGLGYQWYKSTNALSGEVSSSVTLTNVSAAECTRTCVKQGSDYALVSGGKVYTLKGDAKQIDKYAGQKVTVKGTVKKDELTAQSVTPAKAAAPLKPAATRKKKGSS